MSGLTLAMYLQTDLICIVVLAILGYNSRKRLDTGMDTSLFLEVILATILIFVSDSVWALVDGKTGTPIFRYLNIISSGTYLVMTAVAGCIWVIFVDYKLHGIDRDFRKRIHIYEIPLTLLLIVAMCSPITKWLYYVDEFNVYHRGRFHVLQVMVGFCYILFASMMALFEARHMKDRKKRKETRIIASFAVFPMLGGALQVIWSLLSLAGVGITFSIMVVYLNIQNRQISKDALTGVNNRRQFNQYFDEKLSEKSHSGLMYVIIMDIDKFKYINDTFGHIEGDNALVRVADVLESVCARHGSFLARYGGDEFAIICECQNEDEVETFKNEITTAINIENAHSQEPYTLSLSMGSAKIIIDGETTQDEIVEIADKQLYEVKNMKKIQNRV